MGIYPSYSRKLEYDDYSMATLTEVSVISRKAVKYGAYGAVIIILIPVVVRLGKRIYLALNPPPPPPPTVLYGKLPKLVFPPTDAAATPEYKLETIEGGLPKLPEAGRVYVVGINKSRLLELDRIKEKVRLLGFVNNPEQLDESTYRFFHPTIAAQVTVNIISRGFAYKYDWTAEMAVYSTRAVPVGNTAITEGNSYFEKLGLLTDDLAAGSGKSVYLVATNSAMVPTDNLYEANFVRVDLFRANRDDLKIVTAGGDTSPVNVIISSLTSNKRVVQANYQYSQVLEDSFATYPLKNSEVAWQELIAGGGYVAKRTTPQVTIRKVYMGYYESNDPQQFMQPVIVFEGDYGFLAYVPAVTGEYIQ